MEVQLINDPVYDLWYGQEGSAPEPPEEIEYEEIEPEFKHKIAPIRTSKYKQRK